ncbi:RlmE family RNA methyltransferase [Telmatospirillum siberiense]|uniref:Ribosomal RNA large subunit methyltransferase E n=1 Tax=Telmatospirillum siberiense TaxID=382514 RepID=A0A2N3PUA9_9PROT|nr:RlmE family RNA methyltransferase [Telmatospirillum siberiense]PKU23989.1 23S rRNA methyltransferase [Telmatospirillum siberiense]
MSQGKKPTGGPRKTGSHMLNERVLTARKRTVSSTRWLQRQLNDPFVIEAKRQGYRSRAAFKLIQLDDRFHFLRPGKRVVDLGAAPGGWTQVAVQRVKALDAKGGKVVGIDILEWAPVAGAIVLTHDFLDDAAPGILKDALGGPADIVLSDMAAPTTGHPPTDHARIVHMCEVALDFAMEVLAPGGTFVAKVFKGGTERTLLDLLKKSFEQVRHAKPPASRAESAETYVVAMGFRPK